jgi:hypothetical protein
MTASRRWIIVAFTLAFLGARVTGAHMHLCLDGSEPLSQLHVADTAQLDHHPHDHHFGEDDHGAAADHHEGPIASDESSHEDVDVDAVGAAALAKIVKLDGSLIALLSWVHTYGVLMPASQPPPAYTEFPPRPPPQFLRPQLRGPPV